MTLVGMTASSRGHWISTAIEVQLGERGTFFIGADASDKRRSKAGIQSFVRCEWFNGIVEKFIIADWFSELYVLWFIQAAYEECEFA